MFTWMKSLFEKRTSPLDDGFWTTVFQNLTASGSVVSPETALNNQDVLACVRILAESIAKLPVGVFERSEDGRRRRDDMPLDNLFSVGPNDEHDNFTYFENMMRYALLYGYAPHQIVRDNGGKILALWPLEPSRFRSERNKATGELEYFYRGDTRDSQDTSFEERKFSKDEIWVFCGPFGGKSIITLARESIGLSNAALDYGSRTMDNDARSSVSINIPHPLGNTVEERRNKIKDIRQEYMEKQTGRNRGAPIVMDNGATVSQMSFTPQDAQFLETRRFQKAEIAGWFLVPPHMIGELSHATFNNFEQAALFFVVYTILSWTARIESSVNHRFFRRSKFYLRFNVNALLRGDSKARAEFYRTLRDSGVFTINDILQKEEMNKVPKNQGGDIRLHPLNFGNLENLAGSSDADFLTKALNLGLELGADSVYTRLGIKKPSEGEEVLGVQKQPEQPNPDENEESVNPEEQENESEVESRGLLQALKLRKDITNGSGSNGTSHH